MSRSISSFICAILLLVSFGCSGSGFLVVQDSPKGARPDQTLGLRAVVDTGSVTPTERYSWLELCDKVVTPTLKFFSSTNYVNCEPQVSLTQVAQKTTTTGWVSGVVGPVIQTGMMAAAVAYAGHEIGDGISQSGTKNTTTNNNTGGNGNGTASSNQFQGQLQGQKQTATGGSAHASNSNTNLNSNINSNQNHATGGNGVGNGGQGGNGGVGQGGNGGNGGQGGSGCPGNSCGDKH